MKEEKSHLECEEVQVSVGSSEQQSASFRTHGELLHSGFIQTCTHTEPINQSSELRDQ